MSTQRITLGFSRSAIVAEVDHLNLVTNEKAAVKRRREAQPRNAKREVGEMINAKNP